MQNQTPKYNLPPLARLAVSTARPMVKVTVPCSNAARQVALMACNGQGYYGANGNFYMHLLAAGTLQSVIPNVNTQAVALLSKSPSYIKQVLKNKANVHSKYAALLHWLSNIMYNIN